MIDNYIIKFCEIIDNICDFITNFFVKPKKKKNIKIKMPTSTEQDINAYHVSYQVKDDTLSINFKEDLEDGAVDNRMNFPKE
tara:strand:- start:2746 stop:2991 length:246 start_codon:yes stop_codon:yes gene_type:complete